MKQFHRYADHVRNLPTQVSETIQIGTGAAMFRSRQVHGRDLLVARLQFAPLSTGYTLPDADWCVFLLPLCWEGEYRYNGGTATSGDVFLSAGPSGYATSGSRRDTIAIATRKSRLRHDMAALAGIDEDDVGIADAVFSNAVAGRDLRAITLQLMQRGRRTSPESMSVLSPVDEAEFLTCLSLFVLRQHRSIRLPSGTEKSSLAIVRAVEGMLRGHPDHVVKLAECCKVAGVGQTRLHAAFSEIYGVAPSQYIRRWKLSQVRETLLCSEPEQRPVKDTALRFGFLHSGRFAAYYHDLFGETPSDTVRQSGVGGK